MYRPAFTAVGAAIAASLACPIAAQPAVLTDSALDAVTAGTLLHTPLADGERPTAIVADGARYTLQSQQDVELAGEAQAAARVLNAATASGSDVANAANVLSLDARGSTSVRQENLLTQRELQAGALGGASLQGQHMLESTEVSRAFSSASSSTLVTGFKLQAQSRTTTVDQFSAFVPAFSPLQNLTLTIGTPALSPIHIPSFGFDFVEDTDVGDFGIRGTVGPFTLGPPQLVLGTFSLDGDDLVLSSGFVQLPSLDLGSASVDICFFDCAGGSVDLGGFTGPRVDFPGGDLRFDGANPFKDTRINAGHGIATVGEGSISVTPGHLTLEAVLELDLPDPSFSFDFTIPGIDFGDLGSIGPFHVDGPDIAIVIPAVGFSHALIDEDVGVSFDATFNGMLCLAFGATNCGTGSRSEQHEELRVEEEIFVSTGSSSMSGGEITSGARDVHAGATLTAAEAELIVMSQSSADIDASNRIVLGEHAQRGMRAVNAVNASSALVGNTLNVTSLRNGGVTAAVAVASLGQLNAFVQYRTRYGIDQ